MRPRQKIWLFIAAAIAVVLLCNCNPAKQLAKQQEQYQQVINDYLVKHPQPVDTFTKFLPGRIDSVLVEVPVTDPNELERVKDSVKTAIAKKYAATMQDCNRQVNEAFETGREQAYYEWTRIKIPLPKTDTIERLVVRPAYENSLKEKISSLESQLKAEKDKPNLLWYLILSILINLLLVTVIVKRK